MTPPAQQSEAHKAYRYATRYQLLQIVEASQESAGSLTEYPGNGRLANGMYDFEDE